MFLFIKLLCATLYTSQECKNRDIERLTRESYNASRDSQAFYEKLCSLRTNKERVENEIRESETKSKYLTRKMNQLDKYKQTLEYHKAKNDFFEAVRMLELKIEENDRLEDECSDYEKKYERAKAQSRKIQKQKFDAVNGKVMD